MTVCQQRGVRGDPRLDLAAAVGFEECRMKTDHMIEHRAADIRGNPLAYPGHEVETGEGSGRQQQHDPHEHQHGVVQLLLRTRNKALIHQDAHSLPQAEADPGREHQRRRSSDYPPPVRAQKAHRRLQQADAGAGLARVLNPLLHRISLVVAALARQFLSEGSTGQLERVVLQLIEQRLGAGIGGALLAQLRDRGVVAFAVQQAPLPGPSQARRAMLLPKQPFRRAQCVRDSCGHNSRNSSSCRRGSAKAKSRSAS